MNDTTVEKLWLAGITVMSGIVIGIAFGIMNIAPALAWTLLGTGFVFPVLIVIFGVVYCFYKLVKMVFKK